MKKLWIFLLLVGGRMLFAQSDSLPDTVQIKLDHLELEDVVVLDEWEREHRLQKAPGQHQLEAQLVQLKGVNLISRGSFAQEAVYRGQQGARLQVRLNGMRIYSACTDRMDPATSYVVANNLQTAQATSACESDCSNSGLAGNLDLKMKQATFKADKNWRWGLSQQFHSNTRGLVSNVNLEQQVKNFSWRLNGSWQQHQNYRSGGGEEVQHSQNQKQNWALNTFWRIAAKEMLNVDVIYDLATNVGYPALPMDVGRARGIIAGATYSNYLGLWKFSHFDFKLYHNDIYHEMDDTQRENVFMHMDMPGWSQTTGAIFNAHGWKAGQHELSITSEYYTNYRKAQMTMFPSSENEPAMFMFTWPDARIHGAAIGLTDEWHWHKNHISFSTRLDFETSSVLDEIGVRQWEGMGYEMKSRSFLLPQIKGSVMRSISGKHGISAALSYGQRGASTSELYGFYLFNAHDGYDYLGKPDLKPETLYSAEMGHSFKSEKWSVSTTTFVQRYQNYIFGVNSNYDAMTWGARGVRIYENTDRALFYGIEASSEYQLTEKIRLFARAEYLRGLLNDRMSLPLIPPLQGMLGAAYQSEHWSFSGLGRAANEQQQYSKEYGDKYTPAYLVFDAAVAYSRKFNKLTASFELSANNIFDSYYRDHLNWGGIPSMGRNLVLKVSLNY